jgi:carbonic anhydrase/acetyltransferase-like protein (isoleucine patch superfamily)
VTLLPFNGHAPRIAPDAFVAPGARLIGDVELGPGASVWYNCVLRGDLNRIVVGARSNVQDGSIIHVDSGHDRGDGLPTIIGAECLIGHLAIVHGCTLDDGAFVGMGAIVMDGCVIESGAMLAAGGLLTPGKRIPAGELWAGTPARFVRALTPEQQAANRAGAIGYAALAQAHRAALAGA